MQEELYEMSKPLARYADDEDLERMLKARERDGDPMLAYVQKKRTKVEAVEGKTRKRELRQFEFFCRVSASLLLPRLKSPHNLLCRISASLLLPLSPSLFFALHVTMQRDQATEVQSRQIASVSAQAIAGMVWTVRMVLRRRGLQPSLTRKRLQMKPISGV